MTFTLNIPAGPQQTDAAYQEKLREDAESASPSQESSFALAPLRQGSPEWKALLRQPGPARGVVLPPGATSRESIYGDDGR